MKAPSQPGRAGRSKNSALLDPPVEECPARPLGYCRAFVAFSTPAGDIRWEMAINIRRLLFVDIFNWPRGDGFYRYWIDSEGKFQSDLALIWFISKCRE